MERSTNALQESNLQVGNSGELPLSDLPDVLLDLQRLAGIGFFTNSVAHELANLLSIVAAASSSLRYELGELHALEKESIQHYLHLIERNTYRSAQIASLLQRHGTQVVPGMAVTDVETLVGDALMLVERQFREENDITITLNLPPQSRSIVCDHNLLVQLLVNLFSLGRDALAEGGGEIALQVMTLRAGESLPLPQLGTLPAVPYERVGLLLTARKPRTPHTAPAAQAKVFSTDGRGTREDSLALRVAREIVQQHQGQLWIANKNSPSAGAVISVTLPMRPRE